MADDNDDLPEDREDKGNYEVGYGVKPPREHRFKAGQSANPRGRRKGRPNLKTFIDQEMGRRQWVTVDGKRRLLSNREIAVIAQISKARKRYNKAIRALEHDEGLKRDTELNAQRQDLSPQERETLERHLAYIRKKAPDDGYVS